MRKYLSFLFLASLLIFSELNDLYIVEGRTKTIDFPLTMLIIIYVMLHSKTKRLISSLVKLGILRTSVSTIMILSWNNFQSAEDTICVLLTELMVACRSVR